MVPISASAFGSGHRLTGRVSFTGFRKEFQIDLSLEASFGFGYAALW